MELASQGEWQVLGTALAQPAGLDATGEGLGLRELFPQCSAACVCAFL